MDLLRTLEDGTLHDRSRKEKLFTEIDLSKACHAELDESIVALQENPNIETVFIEDELDKPDFIEDIQSLVDYVKLEKGSNNNSDITSEVLEDRILKPPDGSCVKVINFSSPNGESRQVQSNKLQIQPPRHTLPKSYTPAQQKKIKIEGCEEWTQNGKLTIGSLLASQKFPKPALMQPTMNAQSDNEILKKTALTVRCPTVTSQFKGQDENKKYMYVPRYVTTLDNFGNQIELELVNWNNQLSYVPKRKSGSINASLPINSIKLQVDNGLSCESNWGGESFDSAQLVHSKDAVILISDSEDDQAGSPHRPLVYTNCSILRDKHFKCWSYPARKRNLSGFSMTDPLGFLQSEKQRCRKCLKNVENACVMLSRSLLILQKRYEPRDGNVFGKFKFVEVDEIKSGERKKSVLNKQFRFTEPITKLNLPQSERKRRRGRPRGPNRRHSDVYPHSGLTGSDADTGSDLLLTRKVVFINGEREMGQYAMPRKRRRQLREVNPYKKEYCLKRREPLNSDFEVNKQTETDYGDKPYNLKPCYVEIRPNKLVIEALDKYYATKFDDTYMTQRKHFYRVFNERMVKDLKTFQQNLSDVKALLILNENNLEGMEFEENYPKYDLVFPVGNDGHFSEKLIRNAYFVDSVEKGFIMLVDSEILSRHLLGNTYNM